MTDSSTDTSRGPCNSSEAEMMESLEQNYSMSRPNRVDFPDNWLYQREMGLRNKLGTENQVEKSLYSALTPIARWGNGEQTGGIFNLEFSPDGSLLVAACEKKCIYMFDPLSRKVINSIPNAHTDCVNYVRFLDTRVFATCSDDTTIALWDARNLKHKIRTLLGHSNWVKNIEFSAQDDLLVTAGFDGSIYTWEINNYTETSCVYNRVFQTNGLMRMKLTPGATKMLISTTAGYLILIHDLNLSTLSQDLMGFRPNMYRLMQLSDTSIPMATEYHYLFSKNRKRNRVEFITDFPFGDEAEIISSLQIHPHGWCALSRNVSNSERSEWTCVHDLQEYKEDLEEDVEEEVKTTKTSQSTPSTGSTETSGPQYFALNTTTENRYPQLEISTADIWEALLALREARSVRRASRNVSLQEYDPGFRIIRLQSGLHQSNEEFLTLPSANTDDDYEASDNSDTERERNQRNEIDNIPSEIIYNLNEDGSAENNVAEESAGHNEQINQPSLRIVVVPSERGTIRVSSRSTEASADSNSLQSLRTRNAGPSGSSTNIQVKRKKSYAQNRPRLTHYVEELNLGRGYIKELCFSSDGRLVCFSF